jgi:hypothetical protein
LRGAIRNALHECVGILYRHCVPGELEQRQVVLAVADRNQVVARHSKLAQCSPHTRGLVDAGRQHHECARIGDELEVELKLAQRGADFGLVRLDCGHDRAADRQRRHVPAAQLLQEDLRGRLREDLGLPGRRPMHDGAVLGDDVIEQARFRKDFQQLTQLTSSHQYQLAAGRGQRAQRFDATLVVVAIARQRPVETSGQSHVSHLNSSS